VPEFVKVAAAVEIPRTGGKLVHVRGLDIALFRWGGEFLALNNVCAHQHFSMLHQGPVEACAVTCPMHGWVYDLRTGLAKGGEGRVATYAVRVEGEQLLLELPDE
jgi:nitrite reductase (NADH) small subunit